MAPLLDQAWFPANSVHPQVGVGLRAYSRLVRFNYRLVRVDSRLVRFDYRLVRVDSRLIIVGC